MSENSQVPMGETRLDWLDQILHDEEVSENNITVFPWEDIDDMVRNVDFRIERLGERCIWVCLFQEDGTEIHLNFFTNEDDSRLAVRIHDQ